MQDKQTNKRVRQLTSSFSFIAVDVVRIVAGTQQAECSSSIVHQAVGTALDEALVAVAFVVEVALALVCCCLHTRPTAISSTGARCGDGISVRRVGQLMVIINIFASTLGLPQITLGLPQIVFEIITYSII